MALTLRTKNKKETQNIAFALAKEIARHKSERAFVAGLVGDLGSGKTTFTQGFARGLGVKEKIKSPTFILMQIFELPRRRKAMQYKNFIHIDAYRIAHKKELEHLGLQKMFRDPHNIILIEWADRIKSLLPKRAATITFSHGGKINERAIRIFGGHTAHLRST
ncbi:tRNA (adenosine(37)-N6)-threonylcarbamoyltransferase complex ATPase subunit type 1 TsaE [Patescibacteria group bacterium]|nr:tRNA (adenosine(37)-N6)-threonylcarbamoyltransferase complex ATPase subunit type 1 TsaE [Patescibacteria group bacterium]